MLHVAYALMTEGATPESIEALDGELAEMGAQDDNDNRIAEILALGGEVL